MIDYSHLRRAMAQTPLADWAGELPARVDGVLRVRQHGNWNTWRDLIARLPDLPHAPLHLDQDCISVGGEETATPQQRQRVRDLLQGLHPWRKGPFRIHGVHIDAEWRSDWKWGRVRDAIESLDGQLVLDVGCGNGYYAWRMLGAGARLVVGVEPSLRLVCQYHALRHFLGEHPIYVLPLSLEELPDASGAFDTVFSMGVLYHRRSPFEHLFKLREFLRPGGQLVLETLVIEGGAGQVLVPQGRYAQMRNIWFIPSPQTLLGWLRRAGFHNPRVADVTPTRTEEQRSTEWMRFHSLADFLDPGQPKRTVEGLPAPVRGLFLAEAPH